jgi:hypothetical protein
MLRDRRFILGAVFVVLLLANIIYYGFSGWGLITVKAREVPLGKVIKSIEWQGWVKIYTNLPLDTPITMSVYRVPLAEAMETLAANCGGGGPDGARGPGNGTPPPGNNPGGNPGERNRGGRGGGGGGFGGGVQWHLAFFVAPTTAAVKEEIRSFQEGGADDDAKIYNYPSLLQTLLTDSETTAADPRSQGWPGMKPDAAPTPTPTPAPTAAGDAPATAPAPPAPDPDAGTVQMYLKALAKSADIWIMAPASWTHPVSSAPPPNSSISSAVMQLVSSANGTAVQAIILRRGGGRGPGGPRGGGGGGEFGGDADWEDRARNAINGLPADARADASAELDNEVQFRKTIAGEPTDNRRKLMRQHMTEKMFTVLDARMSRLSPEKRAQRYARMVAARAAAKGH